jgi:hypothetical protein
MQAETARRWAAVLAGYAKLDRLRSLDDFGRVLSSGE